jgi:hypothetical protein
VLHASYHLNNTTIIYSSLFTFKSHVVEGEKCISLGPCPLSSLPVHQSSRARLAHERGQLCSRSIPTYLRYVKHYFSSTVLTYYSLVQIIFAKEFHKGFRLLRRAMIHHCPCYVPTIKNGTPLMPGMVSVILPLGASRDLRSGCT